MCLFAFLKPKFEFEGIFGNGLGHLLRINRENLKFLIFSCILGGLRLFYTIGKLYTQTRYGKPCVFLLSLDQKSSAIHVSSSVFSALLESLVKGGILIFTRGIYVEKFLSVLRPWSRHDTTGQHGEVRKSPILI